MTQNTSPAVMARRREPHDSLDDFPTPPWATRAFCKWLGASSSYVLKGLKAREPAANRGHMVRPLREFFGSVEAADVHDYGAGFEVQDYLFGPAPATVDWTITNPPFRLAEAFIDRALETSKLGVAVIVRTAFLEGVGRYERLFRGRAPTDVLQFSERVVMHRGKLSPKGSTATAYCWLAWRFDHPGHRLHWLPPCRRLLEVPEDYPHACHRAAVGGE